MDLTNIKREELDYILTDTLPVEISELFSYKEFYDFLHKKTKELKVIEKKIKEFNNRNDISVFNGWASAPLKFPIYKSEDSQRELNIMQPISALNVYFFVKLYEKNILTMLNNGSIFSLRYHRKNNELFYKRRSRKMTEYFQSKDKATHQRLIQQTGQFFRIGKYNSLSDFGNSQLWQHNNAVFSKFAKIDYKSCFDSIYTHVFRWILTKDTTESKNIKGGSTVYSVIDRILQNINGLSSNGVIVGPEFSRMIAEILLQHIDVNVFTILSGRGYQFKKDYCISRYVDDIYIFANDANLIHDIILLYSSEAQKYRLTINELKIEHQDTPVVMSRWIIQTKNLCDKISSEFYNVKSEYEEKGYILKEKFFTTTKYKEEFRAIVKDYRTNLRHIVSYVLSTILHKVSVSSKDIKIFKPDINPRKVFVLLEFIFYIYSFCPCFDQTQKFLSILYYVSKEIDFKSSAYRPMMKGLIKKFDFIFTNHDLHDTVNFLLFMNEYDYQFDSATEDILVKKTEAADDPLLWGSLLLYSKYNENFYKEILDKVQAVIRDRCQRINNKNYLNCREFWYVLIFNNYHDLDTDIRNSIQTIIGYLHNTPPIDTPLYLCKELLYEFLQQYNFFYWKRNGFSALRQITYRTHQRSLFNRRKISGTDLFGSII